MSENTGLPPGWTAAISRSKGIPYYYNAELDTTSWDIPGESNQEILDVYLTSLLAKASKLKPTPAAPEVIGCLHLLQKHSGSRRPIDTLGNEVTRTQEQAREQLTQWMGEIGTDVNEFKRYASQYSDCSSGKRKGDLGLFGRKQMQRAFEEAAFALNVGEYSGIVSTDSGEHIIYRYK